MKVLRIPKPLPVGHRSLIFVALQLSFSCASLASSPNEPLGIVRLSHGEVRATFGEVSRLLVAGSEVYSGDIVSTKSNAWVTIQGFDDKIEFSIGPESEGIELLGSSETTPASVRGKPITGNNNRLATLHGSANSRPWTTTPRQSPFEHWSQTRVASSHGLPIAFASNVKGHVEEITEKPSFLARIKGKGNIILSKVLSTRVEVETIWALLGSETTHFGVEQTVNEKTSMEVAEGTVFVVAKVHHHDLPREADLRLKSTKDIGLPLLVNQGFRTLIIPQPDEGGLVLPPSPTRPDGPRSPPTRPPGDPPFFDADPSLFIRPSSK